MVWTEDKILRELRRLHKAAENLSYNSLARRQQALVSAAAYHFGSYRRAIEQAGIEYAEVLRRPRWTKIRIIGLIKQARRRGEELNWSAVTKRRDELGKAAFASLQRRLFGRWEKALSAAGLDSDDISRYRRWDKQTILHELKARRHDGLPLNSGAVQADDPGLHAAAVRSFGSHDNALKAAQLNPEQSRLRRRWTKKSVIIALKAAAQDGQSLSDSGVRRHSPALYGAASRLFGSYTAARAAAGVKFKRQNSTAG
jgi:hypothetical protein